MGEKKTFAVWAPDYPDAVSRRTAERAQHLEGIKQLAADGFTKIGGPLFDPASDDNNGSLLIVEAESAEAVRAVIEKDVYWTKGIWDKEKLEIRVIKIAFNSQ